MGTGVSIASRSAAGRKVVDLVHHPGHHRRHGYHLLVKLLSCYVTRS
jgi:hypothetical protein